MVPSSTIDPTVLRRLTHDIKSPLTAVRVLADMLQEDVAPELRADLDELVAAVDHAVLLTEEVGSYARAVGEPTEGGARPLGPLVAEVLDRPAFAGIRLEGDSDRMVAGNDFGRALTSVLVNALRLGGDVQVQVGTDGVRVVHSAQLTPEDAEGLLDVRRIGDLHRSGVRASSLGLDVARRLLSRSGSILRLVDHAPLIVDLVPVASHGPR